MAKGRVTPEVEEWALWELPLSRALVYQHCALRSNGEWTVPLDGSIASRFDDMLEVALAPRKDDEDAAEDDFDT